MANSPARAAVDVGSVIADTYTIEAMLGRGGMGAVFLASHKRLAGKRVAIKILHTELEDESIVARFKREAEIAAKLNHPNIVGVIDYNVAPDGMPYLVLDYLEGETLAQRIARGPMPLDQVTSIVRQVGSALAAAHRAGIVHRDLKPQNIFLVPSEADGREIEIAKVLDFGISKIRGSQTVKTQDSTLLGTPQYMAPEQATGQHAKVDERTDVFALGAIIYEMLSGQPAFSGASIPEVVFKVVYEPPAPLAPQAPSTPPAVLAAVERAMAKRSEDRFPTVTAFVEALTGVPLTVPRGRAMTPPASEPHSAARRVTTGEAFDQTMGSGDLGSSPISPPPPTVALGTPAPPGTTKGPDASSLPAPTVDLRPRAQAQRRSPGTKLTVLALAGAAAAGGAGYLVMRDRAPQATQQARVDEPAARPAIGAPVPPTPQPVATPPAPRAETPVAVPQTAQPDPRPATSAPPKAEQPKPTRPAPHAKPAPAPPAPLPAPPVAPDSEGDGDGTAADRLREAQAALQRQDYDTAERLANAVINSPAGPKQRAGARMIHGTVQCIARNDQEAAQIDLRNLEGFRGLKTRLLSVCRNHGIVLNRQ